MHLRAISAFAFTASLALGSTALGLVTSGETRLWTTTAGWTIAGLAFGGAALAAALRVAPGRLRTAWLLWAAASTFWVAGALGRGVVGAGTGSLPVPSFADVLWCLFAVVSIAGIALRSPRGLFSFPLYALDTVPLVLLAAGLGRLAATPGSHPFHARDAFALAYPIVFVFLALVSTHFVTLQGFRRAWRRGSVVFVGGWYLLAAGAVTWGPQALDSQAVDDFWPGLFWTLGLLTLAGYGGFRALAPAGSGPYYAPERERGRRAIPPAAAIGGLAVLDLLRPEGNGGIAKSLLVAAVVAFGIRVFLVRQGTGRLIEALAAERDFTSAVIETAGSLVCVIDREGRFVRFNRACEELSGYTREEVLGRPSCDLLMLPEEQEMVAARIARVHAGDFPNEGENHWLTRSGERRLISWSNTALLDAKGEIEYVVSSGIDITKVKAAQARLAAAEEKYRRLVEQLPLVTYTTSFERPQRLLFIGPQIEPILGYSVEELLENPQRLEASLHPEDRERVIQESDRFRAEGGEFASEYRCVARDGRVVWFEDASVVVRDEAGEPLYVHGYLLDVTERKRAEQALREAEERYRTLVEQLPAIVYTADEGATGAWHYVSPPIASILGFTAEEWTGDLGLWAARLHPDDRERVHAAEAEDVELGRNTSIEYRLLARDGRVVWVRDQAVLVRGTEGAPCRFHGLLLDITEQKRSEEALAGARQALEAMIDAAPLPIVSFDRAGCVTLWNPAAERTFGWSAEEVLGRPNPMVAEEQRADFLKYVGLIYEGKSWRNVEAVRRRKDGSEIDVSISSAPLRDTGGAVSGMIALLLDVTEKRRAEEALRETTQMLEGLIEASPVAIMAIDHDGLVTLWNPAAERAFGWTRQEAIGSFNPVVGEAGREEFLQLLARILEGESWRDKEITRRRKDGSQIELSVSSGPLRTASGGIAGMVSLIVDVTERKLAEAERERLVQALSEQNERLLEVDRLKDEFVALVSHELRTPLTSIRGYLELLMDGEVGDMTPEQAEFLAIVDRNAIRLLRLVGDLLLVAQLESGTMHLVLEEVDLAALAADAVSAVTPAAERKGILVALETVELPSLQADRTRLAQVIDNFLSNAIKFTPEGGAVTLRLEPLRGAVAIEVADTGMGMTPEETEQLFERFFRTAEAKRQAIQGTGLGLTITKGIVEAHGGTVSVESEQGVGTTFRVVLPSVNARAAADHAPMEEAA